MEKSQRLTAAVICVIILTIMRVFFTILFFISSVICILHAESRVERCDGHLTLSQKAVDSLNTTSTFVETAVSSFLIFLIFRWKPFNFRNFLKALPRQGHFWMWTALWIARIFTNVLIGIIPGIQESYSVLIVLGFSLPLEFALTTVFACALAFVGFDNVKAWLYQHFPTKAARKLTYLYRTILFTYGLRMLALFLYDSFLVARHITRQSEYRELDSILLALDVFYRGSLCVFFFQKFFEFPIPDVLQKPFEIKRPEETDEQFSKSNESLRSGSPEKLEDRELEEKENDCVFGGSDVLSRKKDKEVEHMEWENSSTTVIVWSNLTEKPWNRFKLLKSGFYK